MALAKIDTIRQKLKASYRIELYRDLYESLKWITDGHDSTASFDVTPSFPFWPLLKPKQLWQWHTVNSADTDNPTPEVRIRDTFNATAIMLAKLRPHGIKPEYTDIDSDIISGMRTAYWQKRCNGNSTLSGWGEAINSTAFDMIMTGYGITQIGLKTNQKTGKKLPFLRRHRPLNVLFDPYAPTIGESDWICFVHILEIGYAEKFTGIPDLSSYEQSEYFNYTTTFGGHRKVVQVFEYFSFCEDEDPTRAVIVGSFESDAYRITSNEFDCLPFAAGEFMYIDGFEMPQGAVYLQQDLEVQMNAFRQRLKKSLDLSAMIALNPATVSPADMRRIKNAIDGRGTMPTHITMKGKLDPGAKAFDAYPGSEIPPALMPLYEMMQREIRTMSGIDENDRGQHIQGVNTLGENTEIQQQSGAIQGFGNYKLAVYFQDVMQKVGTIARDFDTDPLDIAVNGVPITINDPNKPAFSAEEIFKRDSGILVAEDEMFGAANDMKTQARIQQLLGLIMPIPLPGINAVEVTKEVARLMKLDVSQYVVNPGDMGGMMPPGPGMAPPPGGPPMPPQSPGMGQVPPPATNPAQLQQMLPQTA